MYGWQIPLKILHPPNLPSSETQISRYKFKLKQNLNLELYRERMRKLWVFDFGGFWEWSIFSGNCHD